MFVLCWTGSVGSMESHSPTASIKSSGSAPLQYESDSSHTSTSTYDNHSSCSVPSCGSPQLSRKSSTSSGNHQSHHHVVVHPPQSGRLALLVKKMIKFERLISSDDWSIIVICWGWLGDLYRNRWVSCFGLMNFNGMKQKKGSFCFYMQ